MKQIKIAKLMIQLNLLYWVIYNTYFGWNFKSVTQIESNCDNIYTTINVIAVVIYILPLFSLYESTIELLTKKEIKNDRK
jgi:hypothetical protein